MSATPAPTKPLPVHQVGDRVRLHRHGLNHLGWISSINHRDDGVEYVVRIEAHAGGMGQVVNIWTTSGHSSFLPSRHAVARDDQQRA